MHSQEASASASWGEVLLSPPATLRPHQPAQGAWHAHRARGFMRPRSRTSKVRVGQGQG
jgi:hypothetical protein